MRLDVKDVIKKNLMPDSYMYLYSLVIEDVQFQGFLSSKMTELRYKDVLKELEFQNYVKRTSSNTCILRKKALDLQSKLRDDPDFEEFWDKYHEIVKEWRKTDKAPAEKHWKKLTSEEKNKALNNIQDYYDSLPIYSTGKPAKKARTYLADKNFNDEFESSEDSISNKMI